MFIPESFNIGALKSDMVICFKKGYLTFLKVRQLAFSLVIGFVMAYCFARRNSLFFLKFPLLIYLGTLS